MPLEISRTLTVHWNWRKLLICHLVAALLLLSLIIPPLNLLWRWIDIKVFRILNESMAHHSWLQTFWACANHRLADWVEDLAFLFFFLGYLRERPKEERTRNVSKLLFSTIIAVATVLLINRGLLVHLWRIPRNSPTFALEGCFRLCDAITWMKVKVESPFCFPADHATTALFFATFYSYFAGYRWGRYACFYAAFLCLPRMAVGAHWLSDVVVGGGAIVLIVSSWALCSPLLQLWLEIAEKICQFTRKQILLFCHPCRSSTKN